MAKQKSKEFEQYIVAGVLLLVLIVIIAGISAGDDYFEEREAEWTATKLVKKGKNIRKQDWFTIDVVCIDSESAMKWGVATQKRGVIITDVHGDKKIRKRLHKGDVITSINGNNVTNIWGFRRETQAFDPSQGMFVGIDRYSNPMFVSLPGSRYASSSDFVQSQTPDPFSMQKALPAVNNNFNVGWVQGPSGVLGNKFENWVNHNFPGKHFICMTCGTMIPSNTFGNNGDIYCPNCYNRMVLK